ncbi:MAG: hypothetical protein Q9157_003599 [Trypethelium eluteriae]
MSQDDQSSSRQPFPPGPPPQEDTLMAGVPQQESFDIEGFRARAGEYALTETGGVYDMPEYGIIHGDYRGRDYPVTTTGENSKGTHHRMHVQNYAMIAIPDYASGQDEPKCFGSGLRKHDGMVKLSWAMHSQYPELNLHMSRGADDAKDIVCHIAPRCLRNNTYSLNGIMRKRPSMELRYPEDYMFFDPSENIWKVRPILPVAHITQLHQWHLPPRHTDLQEHMASGRVCEVRLELKDAKKAKGFRPKFSGITLSELEAIQTRGTNHGGLERFEQLVFELLNANKLRIYVFWGFSKDEKLDYAIIFRKYMNCCFELTATFGTMWYYALAAGGNTEDTKGNVHTDPQFPWDEVEPPRWIVTSWTADFQDQVCVSRPAPEKWDSFGSLRQYPNASTIAAVLKLALKREQQHTLRELLNQSDTDHGVTASARFQKDPEQPDHFIGYVSFERFNDDKARILPEADTKVRITINGGDARTWKISGKITEHPLGVDGQQGGWDVMVDCHGKDFDPQPNHVYANIGFNLVGDPTATARCFAAIKRLELGVKERKGGIDIRRRVLRAPPTISRTDTLKRHIASPGLIDAYQAELQNWSLNPTQHRCAMDAVTSYTGVCFNQGAGGTGKSQTLMGIVDAYVRSTNRPVICCAPSNEATDNMLATLHHHYAKRGQPIPYKVSRFRSAFSDLDRVKTLERDIERARRIKGTEDEEFDEGLDETDFRPLHGSNDINIDQHNPYGPTGMTTDAPTIAGKSIAKEELTETEKLDTEDDGEDGGDEQDLQDRFWQMLSSNAGQLQWGQYADNRLFNQQISDWQNEPIQTEEKMMVSSLLNAKERVERLKRGGSTKEEKDQARRSRKIALDALRKNSTRRSRLCLLHAQLLVMK